MDDDQALVSLLDEWNLQHLYELFKKQMIDIDTLKILKVHHISQLFKDLPIGEQARFEHNLENWKKKFVSDENFPINPNLKRHNSTPTIMDILSSTRNGEEILRFYSTNKVLYEEQRNLLINTIANYIQSNNISYSLADCSEIEKQICNIFSTEKLEFYTNGKRGKIYNKLANHKRISKIILKSNDLEEKEQLPVVENLENFTLQIELLRSSKISKDEFDLYWQKCATLRFQQICNSKNTDEIFQLWPEYTKPSGHLLIDIDFGLKFPMAKKLQERWPYFAAEILFLLKTKISCSLTSKKLLQCEACDADSKIFTILWYCHSLFPPQLKTTTDEDGAKYKKKYSIVDSQESFAIIAASTEELDTKLKLLKIQGRSIQPKLLVIGDISKVEQIYVYFDELKYPFVSIISVFDILFKIFFVFNLQYPAESEIFYNFIQSVFYDLPTNKKCIKASAIKHELLKLKK